MSFREELKRRNVYKVGVAYAIAAWLIIQAAAIISPALQLPKWTLPLIIILLSIGFLITLFLAWAYEVTPEGIKRTKEVPLSESITHLTGRKLNYILAGVIVLAAAFILFDNYYLDRRALEPEVVSIDTDQVPAVGTETKTKKSIVVIPFANLSSDKEQESFVDGLSEEMINSITQIPDLRVIARTSSFAFKGSDKTAQEIAKALDVEYILEGSVRKAGNDLRITAQLISAADESHLWSKTYDKKLKDIFTIQEDIATIVADELKITLGIGRSLKRLGGTDNVEAYELYLAALGLDESSINAVNRKLEWLNTAVKLDPDFALAWSLKAWAHEWFLVGGTVDIYTTASDEALFAAQKAVELEPNLPEGYVSLGIIKFGKGKFIDGESDFRKAFGLTTEQMSVDSMALIAVNYHAVGHFKKANEILEEARRNDPLNQGARNQYMFNLVLQKDRQGAEEEYKRGMTLLGDKWKSGYGHIATVRLGSGDILSSDDIIYSDYIYDVGKEHLESPEEGLKELRQFTTNDDKISSSDLANIALWGAYLGDPDFAMDCIEKSVRINHGHTFFFWFPVMREVRQTSRFKIFVREIGLVDYWNKFGWPDICHKLDNGDFVCD